MTEFITFLHLVLENLSKMQRPVGRLLGQPFMTALLLTVLYASYHVVHESDFKTGLSVAFLESASKRTHRLREREDTILQAELRNLAESDKVIDRLLESVLERAPTMARVRLDVIHNGVTGVTGVGLLRYDTTNSVAGAGHAPGPLVQNRPLAEWSDFLQDMLSGHCRIFVADELRSATIKVRLETLNVGTIVVCPAADVQGRLLGAVFMLWDIGTRMPEGADLEALMTMCAQVGTQIAGVLDLRERVSWPGHQAARGTK